MPHVRTQVRDAIAAAVSAAQPSLTRIISRSRNADAKQFPVFRVLTPGEQVETETIGWPPSQTRTIDCRVVVNVLATGDTDTALDAIAAVLEPAILNDTALLTVAEDVTLAASDLSDDASGAELQGMLQMQFQVIVHTKADDPQNIET